MNTHRAQPSRPSFSALRLPVLLLGLCASSCVSLAEHEEALANVKYYQRNLQDLEAFVGELEAENTRLQGELGLYSGKSLEEAAYTGDIDERLSELDRIMSSLGSADGDVTVLQVEGGYGLRMPDAILFDSGSSTLKPEGKELLLQMATEIQNRPFQRIWVRGHTDSDPIVKAETKRRFPYGNHQLSTARAIEVAALLAGDGGIDWAKLVVAGFGPSDPVAPNSVTDKSKNRRVELFVIEDQGK